jgi:hypothetical protein
MAECACLWEGSFADVQADTDIVVAGTVLAARAMPSISRIEETLRGDPYRDEMRVWMQTRDYCRPPAEDFPPGSRWVMALTKHRRGSRRTASTRHAEPATVAVGDYYLSSCGGYWLSYSGEAVTGNLVDAPRWAREVEMTAGAAGTAARLPAR